MDSKKAESGLGAATELIGAQKQAIWTTVNTCIAFNGSLLALLGAAQQLSIISSSVIISVSFLGGVATVSWGLIINRHFAYYSYFFAWAKEYEKSIHGDESQMIQLGEKYSLGKEVVLPISKKSIRMGWAARLFRVEWLIHLITISFLLLYLGVVFKAM